MKSLLLLLLLCGSAQAAEAPPAEALGRDLWRFKQKMELELRVFAVQKSLNDPLVGDVAWAAELDPWRRRGRVSLGAGRGDAFALRFDARLAYEGGGATRARVRVDLTVASTDLRIQLPDVHLRVTSVYGEPCVEATVPVIEARF